MEYIEIAKTYLYKNSENENDMEENDVIDVVNKISYSDEPNSLEIDIYSRLIMTELQNILIINVEKIFSETFIDALMSLNNKEESLEVSYYHENLWKWKNTLNEFVLSEEKDLGEINNKFEQRALLKWSLKEYIKAYIIKICKRGLLIIRKKVNNEIINIYKKLRFQLMSEPYLGLDHNSFKELRHDLDNTNKLNMIETIQHNFSLLGDKSGRFPGIKDLVHKFGFSKSGFWIFKEANKFGLIEIKPFLKMLEEMEDLYIFNGMRYTESRLLRPTLLFEKDIDPARLKTEWINEITTNIEEEEGIPSISEIEEEFWFYCC